jgi:hypothetical protein
MSHYNVITPSASFIITAHSIMDVINQLGLTPGNWRYETLETPNDWLVFFIRFNQHSMVRITRQSEKV